MALQHYSQGLPHRCTCPCPWSTCGVDRACNTGLAGPPHGETSIATADARWGCTGLALCRLRPYPGAAGGAGGAGLARLGVGRISEVAVGAATTSAAVT